MSPTMPLLLSLSAMALVGCGAVEPAPRTPTAACQPASAEGFPCWPEGLTPASSPVYVYDEVTIQAPPDVVWERLTRADRWPTWFPRAKNVRFEAGGPVLGVGTIVVWDMLGATIRVTVRRADAPAVLAWEGGGPGVHAYHAWLLVPAGRGTRVVTVETERGPVPSLLGFYLRGALHDAHEEWLRGLAKVATSP
jgi:uncharacterized protein YndB with AHSA1/START domain